MSDLYDYRRLQNTATRLITRYGKPITLTRKDPGTEWTRRMNPTTRMYEWVNNVDGTVVTTQPSPAVYSRGCFGVQDRYKVSNLPGLTIQAGDIRLYAIGIPEPVAGDLITLNGKTKTVVTANPVEPGDTVLVWDIQLR